MKYSWRQHEKTQKSFFLVQHMPKLASIAPQRPTHQKVANRRLHDGWWPMKFHLELPGYLEPYPGTSLAKTSSSLWILTCRLTFWKQRQNPLFILSTKFLFSVPHRKLETADILKVRGVTPVSFIERKASEPSWLELYRGLMSHYNSITVWLTMLHDSPSKKLINLGNSEAPWRHSGGSFPLVLSDFKDYVLMPPSSRREAMLQPSERQVAVFSAGQLSDLGALIFFTITPKCHFCQKVASYPCQIPGW